MSFGYSVGDCIKLLELANELRRRFIDAPTQFRDLSNKYVNICSVLLISIKT
jgi:hypothetical protein